MPNKTEYIIRYSILIIFFIILSVSLYPVWKYSVAWGESMLFPYLPENFLRIFFVDPHGWILLSFVEVFTNRYMPVLTGLHHQDYLSRYNIYLLSVIYFGFVFAFLKSFEKYFKNKCITPLALTLIFPLILIFQFRSSLFWCLNHDLWFYSYILNPIFPFLLFSQWEYYYLTEKSDFSKWEKIYNGILLFLTATGHEFFRIILLLSIPLCYILNNRFLPEKYSKKKFLIAYTFLFLINTALVLFSGFRDWMANRMRNENEIFSILIPYLKEYCHNVLFHNIFLLLLIAICTFFSILFTKNSLKTRKILITSFSLLFSVLVFNIMIIVGAENYEFAFNHQGVRFLTTTALFFIFLSMAGYIISSDVSRRLKTLFSLILLIVLSSYCFYHKSFFDFGGLSIDNKEFRQKIYICEKLYHKKGRVDKTAYLPDVDGIPDFAVREYIYWYDKNSSANDYKIVRIGGTNDDYRSFYKNETGEEITDEELDACIFSDIINPNEKNKR